MAWPGRQHVRRTSGVRLAAGRRGLALAALLAAAAAAAQAGPEEQAFARAHPVWRVTGDPSWRPYSFRGPDGKLVGLDLEYSKVLQERVGARLQWVDVPSWAEALRRFRAGEVDLLMGTAATPEREAEMDFTQPYAASPVAVLTRMDAPFLVRLKELEGQTVAVPEGHVTTDYLRRSYPDFHLQPYPELDDAVRAVAEGRADAVVAGLVPAATAVRALGLENLKVAGLVDARFDLRVAVRKDWPQARRLLDAAIAAEPPEVRIERFDRWLEPVMGLQAQALRWRTFFRAGLALASLLALGLLGAFLWTRSLSARVDRATAALRVGMAARAESELRFRTMFERAPLGMYRSTPAGAFLSVNPFLARLFEYASPEEMLEAVRQGGIAETIFEDPAQREGVVKSAVESPGGLVLTQVRYRTRTGRIFDALLSMTAIDDPVSGERTLLGFVQDVSARVRDEATRRQREKLLALGQMAGGVAHDFNNLLTVVLSEADLLGVRRRADPEVTASARRIGEAVEGSRATIGRLLRFVRGRATETPAPYDAHQAVQAALELFRAAGGHRVRVEEALAAPRSRVLGVASDLQNAVLNLCLNARDAMPRGGLLTVRSAEVALDPDACLALAPDRPAPGAFLELTVADVGVGMSPEVLASCREPFFTTKGEGGTGLGLWSVQSVVAEQGGAMRVESAPGEGTTVTLYLPLVSREPAPAAPPG